MHERLLIAYSPVFVLGTMQKKEKAAARLPCRRFFRLAQLLDIKPVNIRIF